MPLALLLINSVWCMHRKHLCHLHFYKLTVFGACIEDLRAQKVELHTYLLVWIQTCTPSIYGPTKAVDKRFSKGERLNDWIREGKEHVDF